MKKLFFSISAMLVSVFVHGQVGDRYHYSPYIEHHTNVIPQTPNAASLGQFGNLPVDIATGLPSISIPIYTLQEDGVSIPISISYHASGVKVDDLASVVGLKWSLNAGGGIFRTVKGGKADETGWLTTHTSFIDDNFYDNIFDKNDHAVQQALGDNNYDHDPDDFNYSFPGGSGKFIFKPKMAPQLMYERKGMVDIIPKYTVNSGGFYSLNTFEAKDYVGNIFKFETTERNKNTTVTQVLSGTNGTTTPKNLFHVTTGWMLSEVNTKNNKTINLGYESYNFHYEINGISQRFTKQPVSSSVQYNVECGSTQSADALTRETTNGIYDPENKLINFIESENVRVDFTYSINTAASDWKKQLDKITIKDKITNKQKAFHFVYGTFNGDPRLQLKEVYEVAWHIAGQATPKKPSYVFTYDESIALPTKGSFAKDYWGFYNGKTNQSLVPHSGLADSYLPSWLVSELGDRDQVFNYTKAGILTKIQYPTGGNTEFTYELLSQPSDAIKKGGLRIKEAKDFDGESRTYNQTLYEYGTLHAKFYEKDNIVVTSNDSGLSTYIFSSDVAVSDPDLVQNGYFFEKVTQKKQQASNSFLKTEYYFKQDNTLGSITSLPEKTYVFKNDAIIQKTDYIHSQVIEETLTWNHMPLKQYCYTIPKTIHDIWGESEVQEAVIGFHAEPLKNHFKTYKTLLSKEITTSYNKEVISQSGGIEAAVLKPTTILKKYAYNADLLVTRTTTDGRYNGGDPDNVSHVSSTPDYDTHGEYFWVDTTYPSDYPSVSSLQNLVTTKNLKGLPISQVVTNEGTQIQGQFFTYDANGNIKESYKYYKGLGTNSSTSGYVPSGYNLVANYSTIEGKPIQMQQEDGSYIAYVWDETFTHVMAKVENATYAQATAQFSGSIDLTASEASIISQLNAIRSGLSDAQVTTFLYDPLIGVKSVTDPRGETVYYEYDNFGRLDQVKDAQGKILSKNEYNYKN